MIKQLLFLSLSFLLPIITAQAMEAEQMATNASNKIIKSATLATTEERFMYGSALSENFNKVVSINGFAKPKKSVLTEAGEVLKQTDFSDDQELKGAVKYTKYAILALKGIADEETYNEQAFFLGQLSLISAECNVRKIDQEEKKRIKQTKKTIQDDKIKIPSLENSLN